LPVEGALRLSRVRIRNFRSLWCEGSEYSVDVALADAGNYFAGPNNAGKSNLFRALELALASDPPRFDKAKDWPEHKVGSNCNIVLDFDMGQDALTNGGLVGTLARMAHDYERAVGAASTFAEEGRLVYHVQFSVAGARTEKILAKGAGAKAKRGDKLEKLLAQFHQVVQFVDVRSGESLESMMRRGFREILGSVLKEKFASALAKADVKQKEFRAELSDGVLKPLAQDIRERVARYVPDLKDVELVPAVGTVDDAIIGSSYELTDAAKTALEQKGTGVRGAVLLTLMSLIAEASRRAVVLAIEEPESFLHPGRHRELGRALEQFTKRPDVTLLVTTHSPFIFAAEAKSCVFSVSKTDAGQTQIRAGSPDQLADRARRLLMESPRLPSLVDLVGCIPADGQALVVEGESDRAYVELAARKLGKPLNGIFVVPCAGASDAALKALLLGDLIGRERVFALLDADEAGKSAKAILVEKLKTAKFQGGQVLLYSEVVGEDGVPVEAEDLFPEELVQEFLKVNPQFMAEYQRGKNRAHIGLTKEGKAPFCAWLESHVKLQQLGRWNDLIEKLVARAAVAVEKRKAAAAAEMPGGAVLPASSGSERGEPSRCTDGTAEAPQHD
jgi:putative ATP-dependent endonuclease of OLD family